MPNLIFPTISPTPAEVVRTCPPAAGDVDSQTAPRVLLGVEAPAESCLVEGRPEPGKSALRRVCAWCRESMGIVCAEGGFSGVESITHGICPACVAKQLEDLDNLRSASGLLRRYQTDNSAAAADAGLAAAEQAEPPVVVRPHPHGGWTHGRLVPGSACRRIYEGWWPTVGAAREALS